MKTFRELEENLRTFLHLLLFHNGRCVRFLSPQRLQLPLLQTGKRFKSVIGGPSQTHVALHVTSCVAYVVVWEVR